MSLVGELLARMEMHETFLSLSIAAPDGSANRAL